MKTSHLWVSGFCTANMLSKNILSLILNSQAIAYWRKCFFERIKSLQCYESNQEVPVISFWCTDFTIDLQNVPLVCALWMCTDTEIVTHFKYLHFSVYEHLSFCSTEIFSITYSSPQWWVFLLVGSKYLVQLGRPLHSLHNTVVVSANIIRNLYRTVVNHNNSLVITENTKHIILFIKYVRCFKNDNCWDRGSRSCGSPGSHVVRWQKLPSPMSCTKLIWGNSIWHPSISALSARNDWYLCSFSVVNSFRNCLNTLQI